ncbi:hypothetical protein ACFE04_007416 [Oxalis oulophora]
MAPAPFSELKVGHIDDVQELRKNKPTIIPDRFVRDRGERPQPALAFVSTTNVPIIDFSKLANGDRDEISHLASACKNWGIFQMINHEIDVNMLESIEKVAREFFMMPLEEKKKYPMAPGTLQGYGQAFVFSEEQKLDWCNMFALGIYPNFIRNPTLWPAKPASFSETVETYSKEVREVCKKVMRFIAISLGLRGQIFEERFGDCVQAIRMNYYPPCSRPDLVLGLSPHSDGSAITVLQQGKGSSVGLQVLKDDQWVPVRPIPNALVINTAVTNKEKDRLSIVTFYAPSYDIEVGPMAELVDENNPCNYRRYNHGEYSKHYVTNKLQGKKTLDFAKIQNNSSQ